MRYVILIVLLLSGCQTRYSKLITSDKDNVLEVPVHVHQR